MTEGNAPFPNRIGYVALCVAFGGMLFAVGGFPGLLLCVPAGLLVALISGIVAPFREPEKRRLIATLPAIIAVVTGLLLWWFIWSAFRHFHLF